MNNDYTEIAFILDRSGSMQSLAEEAIAGFNQFLAEQQSGEGVAKLTLVLFDDQYLVPVRRTDVNEVLVLTAATYEPRGSTALLDAIGRTVVELGEDLRSIPEPERPGSVIVAILTDGFENSSEKYSLQEISEMIRHQTDVYKWQFLFLGANQDAIATAAAMNISQANASAFAADGVGIRSSTAVLAKKAASLRRISARRASSEDFDVANASMSRLVAEEDSKRRKSS